MTDPRPARSGIVPGSQPGPSSPRGLERPLSEWALTHQHEVMTSTSWMGVQIRKNPLDAWILQELVHAVAPDVIVEIGSWVGGSTLFLAHLLDILGGGHVLSVDISRAVYDIEHPRVTAITGSSADPFVVEQVSNRCRDARTMVIHDGDHSTAAVLADLRAYGELVSVGSYFVVEDGIVDLFAVGSALHPAKYETGPLPAIEQFLVEDDRFEIDLRCERYLLTWNPSGFLRRVR